MRAAIYQLDSFATQRFTGNPAAVMPLAGFVSDATMQAIDNGDGRHGSTDATLLCKAITLEPGQQICPFSPAPT